MRPPFSLVRNGLILTRVLAQHAADDPVRLLIQGSRRVPRRVSRGVGTLIGRVPATGPQALAAYLTGDPQQARRRCADGLAAGQTRGLSRRILAEIALEIGGVPVSLEDLPAATRARALWKQGRMSEALSALELAGRGRTGLARRLRAEALSLDASYRVELTEQAEAPAEAGAPGRPGGFVPRAFHVLTNSLPHTQSGYTLRTHRLLGALAERGVAVQAATRIGYPVLVGIPWGADEQTLDGVRYRRVLPLRMGEGLTRRLERQTQIMARMAREFAPTVLHCTTNYTNALMTAALARALGLPWIYEVRGLLEETWASGQADGAARAAARASERYARLRSQETRMMAAADHLITLSEVMREEIASRGIPAERITVIPNAVPERMFGPRRPPAEARAGHGLDPEGLWIGSISSLVDYEGFDTLLRAAALAGAEGQDVRVLLVGDGAARPALEGLTRSLGLTGAVTFAGKVGPERARELHECLDLFAVPRADVPVCRMVTPLKPIEAMAVGTPVLMSDLPPLRELAEGAYGAAAETALLPADWPEAWAERIMTWPGRADTPTPEPAALVAAGERFAAGRTWAVNAGSVERLYRDVARRSFITGQSFMSGQGRPR